MSELQLTLRGRAPGLIMHAWVPAPMLTPAEDNERLRIVAKTTSKRAEDETAALNRYDCLRGLWLDASGEPTIPPSVVRAAVEAGARKQKMGGEVRECLVVESVEFDFDRDALGHRADEWAVNLQFHAGVKVGQSRVNRVRPRFPEWEATALLQVYDLDNGRPTIDAEQLRRWATTAGQRIGVGDWRPQTGGGIHGRFDVTGCEWL